MTDLEAKKELLSCPGDTIQEILRLNSRNLSFRIFIFFYNRRLKPTAIYRQPYGLNNAKNIILTS
jgi:hypothetical protein